MPDRFLDEYRSRNQELAKLMRRMGICEELGSLFDRVIEETEMYQLPAPEINVTPPDTEGVSHTEIVLFAHRSVAEMSREERTRATYWHACLQWLKKEPMNNTTLRRRFALDAGKDWAVSGYIKEAVRAERIRPHDPEAPRRLLRYLPIWA